MTEGGGAGAGRPVEIGLVQLHAGPDRAENLDRALNGLRRAADAGAGLVVFPELAIDRFFPREPGREGVEGLAEPVPGPTTGRLARAAEELGTVVVFNLFERGDDGRTYDSSPVIDPDGSLLGVGGAELYPDWL